MPRLKLLPVLAITIGLTLQPVVPSAARVGSAAAAGERQAETSTSSRDDPADAADYAAAGTSALVGGADLTSAGTAAPIPAQAPDSTAVRHSAVVVLAGPSVYQEFERLASGVENRGSDHVSASADVGLLAAELEPRLQAAEAAIRSDQQLVVDAAERLGATVVSQYTTAANGLLVHATTDVLSELAGVPGVVAVEAAPLVRPALSRSVPHTGAIRLADETGYLGAESVVAVVDTGVDYTHAAFGGPGTSAAYGAAAAAAETIDDTWDGVPLFPTARVIGGWDFVGPKYTTPEFCTPEREAAGQCTSTPHPDPDPLDQGAHGTNVAGAAAGQAIEGLARGMAPESSILALKIYGPPDGAIETDETVDVLIDAIEWCVRANLGLDVPGIAPDSAAIDVVNLSIGEPYAQGSRLFDEAVDAAVGAGMVVVAAAGNQGDRPYVVAAPGASPRALSVASVAIGDDYGSDTMAGHSGRGPSKNGALKPDIAAPGTGIVVASMGTGTGAQSTNGTSMAVPHVSGAAALLAQRNREEDLGLSGLELSALLMNYARPMLPGVDGRAAPVHVVRQGAGRLNVAAAGTADLLVTGGDIASLNLGALSTVADMTVERSFTVRNLSDAGVRFKLAAEFLDPGDAGAGVALTMPDGVIPLGARADVDVPVVFEIDAESLRGWTLRGPTPLDSAALTQLEVDGYVTVTPVDDAGEPVPEADPARLPFYALPRRASRVRPGVDDRQQLTFDNASGLTGDVELFVLPYGGAAEDPDESDVAGELDVRRVGVRFEPGPGGETMVTFGIALHEVSVVPQSTSYEIYLDGDRDGLADIRVRTDYLSPLGDDIGVRVGAWNGEADAPDGPEIAAGIAAFDLHTRVAMVSVPLSAVGMGPEVESFDFYLISRGLTEDWWGQTAVDLVPDSVRGPCGSRLFTVDPAMWANLPSEWTLTVEAGGTAHVSRNEGTGSNVPRLLALLPDNRFEDPDGQMIVLEDGADPEPPSTQGQCRAFLPLAARNQLVKPLRPPDALLANAIEVISEITDLKLLSDIRDEHRDEERKYRFRSAPGLRTGENGVHMTYSPRHLTVPGDPIQRWDYMRVDGTAWERKHVSNEYVEDWHCYPIDEYVMVWPEVIAMFRTRFPAFGWEIDGQGGFQGRETWMLSNQDRSGPWSYSARVDVENGRLLFLSRYDAAGRSESYQPIEFGVVNANVGTIRNKPCP
ncbi:MAG: S8 family peptidase [Anaerolineae bacterium]